LLFLTGSQPHWMLEPVVIATDADFKHLAHLLNGK
jgi:hypothetical protein